MAKQQGHSKSYHRYFENYAEVQKTNEKGRLVIERVYVGQYYRVDLPDDEHVRRKRMLLLCFVFSAAFFLVAGLTAPISGARFTAIGTMLSLLALILSGIALFTRLRAPREMEVRVWRDSHEQLQYRALAAGVLLCVSAIAMLVSIFTTAGGATAANFIGAALMILSAVGMMMVFRLEQQTEYQVLPPRNERPEGASPIRRYAPD